VDEGGLGKGKGDGDVCLRVMEENEEGKGGCMRCEVREFRIVREDVDREEGEEINKKYRVA
jgi:hypothetical protein